MANTYADNPARGLSRLQKAILVWLEQVHKGYDEQHGPDAPVWAITERPWSRRPQFYGKTAYSSWYGVSGPAITRAVKRLEARGLLLAYRPAGYTETVRLTPEGRSVAAQLVEEGFTVDTRAEEEPEIIRQQTAAFWAAVASLQRERSRSALTVLSTKRGRD